MLFGVGSDSKALLVVVKVEVFSKEAFSILQSAVWIAAVLTANFSLVFGNVHIVVFSFSVNVSSGEAIRYC